MNKLVKNALTNEGIGIGILLLVTFLWGGTFVIIKEALADSSAMMFVAVRFSVASILILPLIWYKRKDFAKSSVIAGAILGVIIFVSYVTQTTGLKYTTATKSGFITGSAVVMIPLLQTIIEKRKPTFGALTGTVIVFLGIMFLSSGGNSIFTLFEELGKNFNFGDFLTLFCALAYALYTVYLDDFSKKNDFWILMIMQVLTTAVLSVSGTFLFNITEIEPMRIEFTQNLFFAILYTAVLATIITTTLQTKYQKRVSPTKAGIVYSFEPIFAATFAFFILGETITGFGLIGCLLIFCGLIIAEVFDNFFGAKNAKKG